MSNGRPPYGDPSQWGNQPTAGQNPAGQFVPVQQQGGQVPPVQPVGYQQPAAGMNDAAQNPYARQNPYSPQNPYGAPSPYSAQSPYAGTQQPYVPPQTYQPQQHQPQQAYTQQSWQPYQQGGYQQPAGYQQQSAYPQQGTGYQQMQYPQFNQQGQQVTVKPGQAMQGYSGYYSRPPEETHNLPVDVVMKVILFGVLPALFILGLVLGSQVLNWVFLGCAVAGIVAMWLKDFVMPNTRLVLSLVYGVMAVVALVSALGGAPADRQNASNANASTQQSSAQNTGSSVSGMSWESTPTPTPSPTVTPDPYAVEGAAVEQLQSFFHFWSVNNVESMVSLTAPSWRATVEDPATSLWSSILVNRTPDQDYEITAITGTENDTTRTATVKATIDKHNGRDKERYSFKVIMLKEDGYWYVDPRSLQSHDKETPTQATVNTTPTQPPLYTGTPNTVLYYNPNGGSMYHLDGDCSKVGRDYKPMSQFLFSQLGESPYSELRPCNVCGAPIPD